MEAGMASNTWLSAAAIGAAALAAACGGKQATSGAGGSGASSASTSSSAASSSTGSTGSSGSSSGAGGGPILDGHAHVLDTYTLPPTSLQIINPFLLQGDLNNDLTN